MWEGLNYAIGIDGLSFNQDSIYLVKIGSISFIGYLYSFFELYPLSVFTLIFFQELGSVLDFAYFIEFFKSKKRFSFLCELD